MSASGATRPVRGLVWLAVVGNALFVAWVAYNAIDSGFRGTLPEVVSAIALAVLLVLDSVLLLRRSRG
jgi:uncharacterized protein YaaW (UPF0174 family)